MHKLVIKGYYSKSPNFFVEGDLAFTEDMHIVNNLFLCRVSRKVTNTEALQYFEKFGKVEKLHIFLPKSKNRRKCSKTKVGYVNFKTAEDAARVLLQENHDFLGRNTKICACNSWHQPSYMSYHYIADSWEFWQLPNEMPSNETAVATCKNNLNETKVGIKFSDLNFHCLEQIFTYLDKFDLLHMARTCAKFQMVIRCCFQRNYHTVKLDDLEDMTLWDLNTFFEVVGAAVQNVFGTFLRRNRGHILRQLRVNCPNLESISFMSYNSNENFFKKLCHNLKTLTKIELKFCKFTDDQTLLLQSLPQLVILSIVSNNEVTGKNLKYLHKLKELNIVFCYKLKMEYFLNACEALQLVEKMDIRNSKSLYESKDLCNMIKFCKKLKILKISVYTGTNLIWLAKLQNLAHLHLDLYGENISICMLIELTRQLVVYKQDKIQDLEFFGLIINRETGDLFEIVSKLKTLTRFVSPMGFTTLDNNLHFLSKLENLKELHLEYCTSITVNGITQLLLSCNNLQHLNLKGCKQFDDSLVFEIISLRNKLTSQLHLDVQNTRIQETILKETTYMNASYFLKLNFKCDYTMIRETSMEHYTDFMEEEIQLNNRRYEILENCFLCHHLKK